MASRIKRAATFSEAKQRANLAALALHHLRIAQDYARYAPNTKARIHKAVTSAGGALRHANGIVARMEVFR
jgi:hypothetical protein